MTTLITAAKETKPKQTPRAVLLLLPVFTSRKKTRVLVEDLSS